MKVYLRFEIREEVCIILLNFRRCQYIFLFFIIISSLRFLMGNLARVKMSRNGHEGGDRHWCDNKTKSYFVVFKERETRQVESNWIGKLLFCSVPTKGRLSSFCSTSFFTHFCLRRSLSPINAFPFQLLLFLLFQIYIIDSC